MRDMRNSLSEFYSYIDVTRYSRKVVTNIELIYIVVFLRDIVYNLIINHNIDASSPKIIILIHISVAFTKFYPLVN